MGNEIDKIIIILNGLSVKKITTGNDEQSASFKKLFGAAFTPKQEEIFASTYFENEETPEKFWDKLKGQTGFNDSAVKKAKQLLSFNLLTDNQPELAQHLFSNQSSDPDLKELSGYAKFTKADWQQQIKSAGIATFPAWVKGETKKEKTGIMLKAWSNCTKIIFHSFFFCKNEAG